MKLDIGVYVLTGLIAAVLLMIMFIYIPAAAIAQADCLERGYPKSDVTWNLKSYCMNLEGTVTIAVEELP